MSILGRRAVASTTGSNKFGREMRTRLCGAGFPRLDPGRMRYGSFRNESGIRVVLEQGNMVAAVPVFYRWAYRTRRGASVERVPR
jgi:hypothetical protein